MLPADQRSILECHTVGENSYLCYDMHHEAVIATHEATVKVLMAQARREQT
jgi:hypothetical protein